MTNEEIINILKTRIAVYKAGVKAGLWSDINTDEAKSLMDYIFPKSGFIALYNLMLEFMRREHKDLTGAVFFLFKLPVQQEKEVMDYLKRTPTDMSQLIDNPMEYLRDRDTIVTDHSMSYVRIGSLKDTSIDNILRLCASHYLFSVTNGIKTYPYFD